VPSSSSSEEEFGLVSGMGSRFAAYNIHYFFEAGQVGVTWSMSTVWPSFSSNACPAEISELNIAILLLVLHRISFSRGSLDRLQYSSCNYSVI